MKNNKGMSGGKIAAMAALGAAAYYLFGPKAKVHQKKAKVLLAKMNKEVISKIKKAKEVTPPLYHQAIDTISKNYAKQYKLHEKDIRAFARQMKAEWQGVGKKVKKTAKILKKKTK